MIKMVNFMLCVFYHNKKINYVDFQRMNHSLDSLLLYPACLPAYYLISTASAVAPRMPALHLDQQPLKGYVFCAFPMKACEQFQ